MRRESSVAADGSKDIRIRKTAIRSCVVEVTRSRWMAFYQRIRFIIGLRLYFCSGTATTVSSARSLSSWPCNLLFPSVWALCWHFVGNWVEDFSLRIDFSEPLVSLHCQSGDFCSAPSGRQYALLKKRLHLLSCCFSCFSVIVTNSGGQYDLKFISQHFFSLFILQWKIKGILHD